VASSQRSAILGRPEPRLATEPVRKLTRHTTLGFEAIRFASEVLGVELLPWQEWWLKHALELNPDGSFRYRTILTLIGRQNGKTFLLKVLALYVMYMGRARLVLGAAQSLDIARESWQGAVDMATSDPELADEIDVVRHANGEQELRLVSGARYRIAAATRSAGRGLSVDLLILDELREHRDWLAWAALSKTTMARPNALAVGISNAGDDASVVLNSLRETALAGTDSSLALFEWSAPDNCDLDDVDAWAQANPGLGHTISAQAIRSALGSDPPAVFRTEVLCQRVLTLDNAVDLAAWTACRDAAGSLDSSRDRVVACVDVAPDGGHVTLAAAAGLPDGRVRVEIVEAWDSTEAARFALADAITAVNPRAVAWFPGGPAASIAPVMRNLPNVTELKGAEVAAVCMGFADLVRARRIVQPGDPLLDAHLAGAKRWDVGEGWRFVRRGVGHVDAAYAAAGAVHAALTVPVEKPKPRMLVV